MIARYRLPHATLYLCRLGRHCYSLRISRLRAWYTLELRENPLTCA